MSEDRSDLPTAEVKPGPDGGPQADFHLLFSIRTDTDNEFVVERKVRITPGQLQPTIDSAVEQLYGQMATALVRDLLGKVAGLDES